jgi:hypothetical protein
MVLFSTSPVMRRQTKSFSRCVFASELCKPRRARKSLPEGRRSADRRTVHVRAAQTSVRELAHLICCAAAAHIASRSPFGAPPRHSPGRTHPPLAQLQFPRFLRPSSTGVTRCRLSRVYRAPRRPVVMPAERWPRAARERFARTPARVLMSAREDSSDADKLLRYLHNLDIVLVWMRARERRPTLPTGCPNGSSRRTRGCPGCVSVSAHVAVRGS